MSSELERKPVKNIVLSHPVTMMWIVVGAAVATALRFI